MSTPIIQLDGAPTPRMRAKRTRRAVIGWAAFCAAAAILYTLRVATDAGVL